MNRVVFALALLSLLACESKPKTAYHITAHYTHFNLPDSISKMSEHGKAQALLGKSLFYDPILSRGNDVSCASCHLPERAFSDTVRFSKGSNNGIAVRNTPPLFNLFSHKRFFMDGGIPRLSEVALAPMDHPHELNQRIDELSYRLRENASYASWFKEVYNREPDPYSITRALMWFQLSLISANSTFDKYLHDASNFPLHADAAKGYALFLDPALGCASCHQGMNFSDGDFHNVGLDMSEHPDTGRARISINWEDYGKIKTPSLRNLGFTAPYMHDGRFNSLTEVLDYYNRGGDGSAGQDPRIRPLHLNATQLQQLEAFLHALNDTAFTLHPDYRP
ncbi:MAG: cytochrome-c peroxidase [Bacteroidia bacterium]